MACTTRYFIWTFNWWDCYGCLQEEGAVVHKIEQGITYKQLNPKHDGTVHFMDEVLVLSTTLNLLHLLVLEYCWKRGILPRNMDKLKRAFLST